MPVEAGRGSSMYSFRVSRYGVIEIRGHVFPRSNSSGVGKADANHW
jgi:hypothetical protein